MKPEVIQNTACCIIIQTDRLFVVVPEDRQAPSEKTTVQYSAFLVMTWRLGLPAAALKLQFQAPPTPP